MCQLRYHVLILHFRESLRVHNLVRLLAVYAGMTFVIMETLYLGVSYICFLPSPLQRMPRALYLRFKRASNDEALALITGRIHAGYLTTCFAKPYRLSKAVTY
jgi:hypothetical protein